MNFSFAPNWNGESSRCQKHLINQSSLAESPQLNWMEDVSSGGSFWFLPLFDGGLMKIQPS